MTRLPDTRVWAGLLREWECCGKLEELVRKFDVATAEGGWNASLGKSNNLEERVHYYNEILSRLRRGAKCEEALREQLRQIQFPGLPSAWVLTMERMLRAALNEEDAPHE